MFPARKFEIEWQRGFPYAISCPTVSTASFAKTIYTRREPIEAEKLAQLCAECASDKKAEDIVALDLRGISSFTDFFVICTGTSEPHLKAISSEIQERLKKDHNVRPSA